jgi:hypothetical protein
MRYFLITYFKRPNGKIDEVTSVAKKLRPKDIQMSNVILDFRDMKVLAANMNGTSVPKDWDKVHNYYYQFYENTFKRLHEENGRVAIIEDAPNNTVDSSSNQS